MQGPSLTSRNLRYWYLAYRHLSRGGDPASQRLSTSVDNPPVPSPGHRTVRPTDPTAKRPNRVCDPYGQGGEPLSPTEVQSLLPTIHKDWKVETKHNSDQAGDNNHGTRPLLPVVALTREFGHVNFMAGSRFLHSLAAVAEMNAHFPALLQMERRIVKRNWVTVSTVRCHTTVLGGLSRHDFHLAMVRASVLALKYGWDCT